MRSHDPGSLHEGSWRASKTSFVPNVKAHGPNSPPIVTSITYNQSSSSIIHEEPNEIVFTASIALAASQNYENCGAWQEAIRSLDTILDVLALDAKLLDDSIATVASNMVLFRARLLIRYSWDLPAASASLSRGLRLNSSDVAFSIEARSLLAIISVIRGAPLVASSQWLLEHVHQAHNNESESLKDITMLALESTVRKIGTQCVHACLGNAMLPVLESAAYYLRSSLDFQSSGHFTLLHSSRSPFPIKRYSTTESLVQLAQVNCSSLIPQNLDDEALVFESNSHRSLASLLVGLGSHEEAALNLLAVPCGQNAPNELPDVADTIFIRDILAALVPSVLDGPALLNDEVDATSGIFKELLWSLSSERWKASLEQPGGIGPTALGTRWHFLLAYFGLKDQRSIMRLTSKVLVHLSPSLNFVPPSLPTKTQELEPVIRVGFISAHWRFHSVGRLLSGVAIALAADTKQRFEVVVLHTSASVPADSTDPIATKLANAESEAVKNTLNKRHRLKQAYLDAKTSSFSEIQETVLSQKLDVLIFGDVGMDLLGSYLALGRFALSQIAFWGHPVTSGSPNMDYFISSALFEPPHADSVSWLRGAHSEQLVMLDGINIAFDQPKAADEELVNQIRADIIDAAFPYINGSENDKIHLYICSQNPTKLHPSYDAVILGILDQDRAAIVVLSHNAAQPLAHRRLVSRLNRAISESYYGNLTDRIVFVDQTSNYDEYLALQCAGDVFLDPYPFGGGVTALEALACRASGAHLRRTFVPIVTAPKLQTVPGLAAGFLRSAHGTAPHDESIPHVARLKHGSIVSNPGTYVNEAIYLASSEFSDDGRSVTGEGLALLWNSSAAVESWGRFIQTLAARLN